MKQGEQGAVGKPPVGGGKRSLPDAHECARRPEESKKLNTENAIYSKIKWVNEPNAQVSKKGVKMFNLFGSPGQDKSNLHWDSTALTTKPTADASKVLGKRSPYESPQPL